MSDPINPGNLAHINSTDRTKQTANIKKASSNASKANVNSADKATISSVGAKIDNISAKTIEEAKTERAEKIGYIKEQLNAGTYTPDGETIAESMLSYQKSPN